MCTNFIVIIIIIIIIVQKTKGRDPVRTKILIDNKITEQVNVF